ncbi:MAG: penicillin-binding transpeptidase domain-containing protein [Paenibacillaceae bacterium]
MGRRIRVRSLVIGGLFTLLFLTMTMKLYWVQIVNGAELLDKAEDSWSKQKVLQPIRGSILDRNDKILAQDGESYTVAVNPLLIDKYKQQDVVVGMLAPLLNMNTPEGLSKLNVRVTSKRDDGRLKDQVEIRNEGWKIDKSVADEIIKQIDNLGLKGSVTLLEERKRYYPTNQLASHVLGYVDKENQARTGIELVYDEYLKGTPGSISYEKDRLGYQLPEGHAAVTAPVNGSNVRTTIDRNIQHYIEEALEKMNEQFHPKGAMVIAADPNTMEILGMSSLPTFNPNTYWDFADQGDFKNHNIASQFEPGSTFKIVTLAGAVDQGIFHPEDTYPSGSIKVPGATIRDHNNGWGWGNITYLEGLKRSSNVAFVKLGYDGLGKEKLHDYIEKFGFGHKTGIDLTGEISGDINFHYPSEVANATFGQGVAVTAIQQVAAISAIANGGKLMRPYLMKEIIDPVTNEVLKKTEPEFIRQVISEQAAKEVSGYLEQVVSDQEIGTGRRGFIDGYRIAGKTGTAQKFIDGSYATSKWVVSFIGYAPADNPQIVLCVIIDDPDIGSDSNRSGEVSAPVFKDIMGKSLRYLNVPKANTSLGVTQLLDNSGVLMPDLSQVSTSEAKDLLSRIGIAYDVIGNGKKVVQQQPMAGTQIGLEQRGYILTQPLEGLTFPDVTGRSMRDVVEVCSVYEADCTLLGEGFVISQKFIGTPDSKIIEIIFEPFKLEPVPEEQTETNNNEEE